MLIMCVNRTNYGKASSLAFSLLLLQRNGRHHGRAIPMHIYGLPTISSYIRSHTPYRRRNIQYGMPARRRSDHLRQEVHRTGGIQRCNFVRPVRISLKTELAFNTRVSLDNHTPIGNVFLGAPITADIQPSSLLVDQYIERPVFRIGGEGPAYTSYRPFSDLQPTRLQHHVLGATAIFLVGQAQLIHGNTETLRNESRRLFNTPHPDFVYVSKLGRGIVRLIREGLPNTEVSTHLHRRWVMGNVIALMGAYNAYVGRIATAE